MLEQAGWKAGMVPPTSYMVWAVIAALVAAVVAGILVALIVGRARVQHALAYGALFSAVAVWANRKTLFDNPHPYEWPLILAPLLAMPLGAWIVVYFKPLTSENPDVTEKFSGPGNGMQSG